jgi:hypothetical protein
MHWHISRNGWGMPTLRPRGCRTGGRVDQRRVRRFRWHCPPWLPAARGGYAPGTGSPADPCSSRSPPPGICPPCPGSPQTAGPLPPRPGPAGHNPSHPSAAPPGPRRLGAHLGHPRAVAGRFIPLPRGETLLPLRRSGPGDGLRHGGAMRVRRRGHPNTRDTRRYGRRGASCMYAQCL